jgi:hypothetical protein
LLRNPQSDHGIFTSLSKDQEVGSPDPLHEIRFARACYSLPFSRYVLVLQQCRELVSGNDVVSADADQKRIEPRRETTSKPQAHFAAGRGVDVDHDVFDGHRLLRDSDATGTPANIGDRAALAR